MKSRIEAVTSYVNNIFEEDYIYEGWKIDFKTGAVRILCYSEDGE